MGKYGDRQIGKEISIETQINRKKDRQVGKHGAYEKIDK